jgi:hypothetical protein
MLGAFPFSFKEMPNGIDQPFLDSRYRCAQQFKHIRYSPVKSTSIFQVFKARFWLL